MNTITRPVKGPLYEGGSSNLKKREIALKRGRLPEKEGDCLKKREICGQLHDIAIWQLRCSFLKSSDSSVRCC